MAYDEGVAERIRERLAQRDDVLDRQSRLQPAFVVRPVVRGFIPGRVLAPPASGRAGPSLR